MKDVTPLLAHWIYVSYALTEWFDRFKILYFGGHIEISLTLLSLVMPKCIYEWDLYTSLLKLLLQAT